MQGITLVTSPHVKHPAVLQADFQVRQDLMYTFAPVGLLSLAATVREQLNLQPKLFDLNRAILSGLVELGDQFYEQAAQAICSTGPDVIGFMTECDSYHHVLQICEWASRLRPDCRIVLGGPHATAVSSRTMEKYHFIDAIVEGEGELSFIRLLQSYLADVDDLVPGVIRRTRSGGPRRGGAMKLIEHLDDLPIPAYDLHPAALGEEMFIEVGRGCPFNCSFCSTSPFWNRRHRVKSPRRILKEIDRVVELFATKRVHFTHDLFVTDRTWVRSVCEALIEAKIPVHWTCSARTDLVDRELLNKMAEAGCDAIYFGLESGSSRVLSKVGKDIDPAYSLNILRECREAGIKPNAGYIVGFPFDDVKSAAETFGAFAEAVSIGSKPTHIFGFCPFVASSIYPTLDKMECNGHFLDIPLGKKYDSFNRELIESDRLLFGSYFRSNDSELSFEQAGMIDGIDEFSPLVEVALLPTITLAENIGGMFEVYRRWLQFISALNIAADKPRWRTFYGGPAEYSAFLADELAKCGGELSGMAEVSTVLAVGFGFERATPSRDAITMATHRSVGSHAVRPLDMGTELSVNNVVGLMEASYDVAAALAWNPGEPVPEIARRSCYLTWQRRESNAGLQLVEVDDVMFGAITKLLQKSQSVASIVSDWSDRHSAPRGWDGGFDNLLGRISEAIENGLVTGANHV